MKAMGLLIVCITLFVTCANASQPSTPRRTFSNTLSRLLLHKMGYDQHSDDAQTEPADSPSHEGQDPLQDITEYCTELDERLTQVENSLENPPFMSLKSPHSAALVALLGHASWLDAGIRNSTLSDKNKDILDHVLQKSRENLKLNCAQTIIMQRHAHNGWHFMAWCGLIDFVNSKIDVDVQPIAIYFGNRFSEDTIKMGIKGISAWCLASLARAASNTRHQQ